MPGILINNSFIVKCKILYSWEFKIASTFIISQSLVLIKVKTRTSNSEYIILLARPLIFKNVTLTINYVPEKQNLNRGKITISPIHDSIKKTGENPR